MKHQNYITFDDIVFGLWITGLMPFALCVLAFGLIGVLL